MLQYIPPLSQFGSHLTSSPTHAGAIDMKDSAVLGKCAEIIEEMRRLEKSYQAMSRATDKVVQTQIAQNEALGAYERALRGWIECERDDAKVCTYAYSCVVVCAHWRIAQRDLGYVKWCVVLNPKTFRASAAGE